MSHHNAPRYNASCVNTATGLVRHMSQTSAKYPVYYTWNDCVRNEISGFVL